MNHQSSAQDTVDVTSLQIELKQWREVYRETVLHSGSTSYCQQVIDQIKADLDRAGISPKPQA